MDKQKPQAAKSVALPILKRVEDFFIPPLCIICDKPLDGGDWLCPACLDALTANHAARDACPRCSINRRKHECACEFAWDFPFEKIFSAYDYDDTVGAIAHHIKYKGKCQLAYHIGFITAPLLPADLFSGADLVIPVPLHKARTRSRGYNQSEYFARGILKGLGRDLDMLRTDLLTRVKNTGTQTKLDKEERQQNLKGAFAADPQGVQGKSIILVDDIFTTGATTEACTEELLHARCAAVKVLSMGHG